MTIPRSSHTVATIGERVYIVGGYTNGGAATNKCEMFDALTLKVSKLADSAYATTNSCLTAINGRSLVRIGGQLPDQTNCHNIEVYDCERNSWSTIDPNVDDVQGEFSLLSNSGSIQLNEHQIFVFGGYNE
jgi:N-acetylneuraminic acid mutarotase